MDLSDPICYLNLSGTFMYDSIKYESITPGTPFGQNKDEGWQDRRPASEEWQNPVWVERMADEMKEKFLQLKSRLKALKADMTQEERGHLRYLLQFARQVSAISVIASR